jgi:formate-dependent nitrite reductase membrane component NrfD
MILLTAIAGSAHLGAIATDGLAVIRTLDRLLAAAVVVSTLMTLGEVFMRPYSADAQRAIEVMTHGKLKSGFWYGVILVGAAIPLVLLWFVLETGAPDIAFDVLAALLALLGLYVFDETWIMAGQAPALS